MADQMTQEDAMNMSNARAIEILKAFHDMMFDQYGCPISDAVFAIEKAIEALSVKHGKWIINLTEPYGSHCSCCGFAWYDHIDAVKLNPVLSKIETKYCPNCGADMRGDR